MADPVTRRKPRPRVYRCAICDRPVKLDGRAVFSRFTRLHYHAACIWKAKP